MAIEYIKKATKTAATGEDNTRDIVLKMLNEIEAGGEEKALEYAEKLDGWKGGSPVLTREQIEAAKAKVPQQVKDDIHFAYERVSGFAKHQRDSMKEFEVELSPGLFAGQKLIPMTTAGCYVPGGRYAHIASAIMSVATAKVAGVENVVACSVPHGEVGVHPAIVYAMDLAGADTILAMGGVQGIAAMAFGLFTGKPADILVGPGNRFVAEAKRMLFGRPYRNRDYRRQNRRSRNRCLRPGRSGRARSRLSGMAVYRFARTRRCGHRQSTRIHRRPASGSARRGNHRLA